MPQLLQHPDQQGLGEKIKIFILGLLSIFSSLFVTLQSKELRLNNRVLKIQKQLGEGGFSYVYLVKDKADGRLYALKRVNIELEEHERMLNQEIKAFQKVKSSNVINLIDYKVVQNSGRVVEGLLLLPFYKNGTAQDLVEKNGGGITLSLICNIGIDICKALRSFHAQKLAFRDLKPANVLIGDDNRAVLMDLGSVDVARVTISSRKDSIALQEHAAQTCTAPFRAPELFDPPSNCLITEATDIWSLGCTIYNLAYGQPPFDGSATASMSAPRFPSDAEEKFGGALLSLIKLILQTNASLRPSLDQIEAALVKLTSSTNFTAQNV